MKYIVIIFAMLVVLTACKKEPQSVFTGTDAISFYYFRVTEADSVAYSFKFNFIPKSIDTIWLKMRLTGNLKPVGRKIKIVTATGTTAIKNTHFAIPESFLLPADSSEVKIPVIIFKTADLNEKQVSVILQIENSEDLIVGPVGELLGGGKSTVNLSRYKINISNRLLKPAFWNNLQFFHLGVYSEVKYQFIISVMGTHELNTFKGGELFNMKAKLRNALDDYVSKNGPMIDENGLKVEFPR